MIPVDPDLGGDIDIAEADLKEARTLDGAGPLVAALETDIAFLRERKAEAEALAERLTVNHAARTQTEAQLSEARARWAAGSLDPARAIELRDRVEVLTQADKIHQREWEQLRQQVASLTARVRHRKAAKLRADAQHESTTIAEVTLRGFESDLDPSRWTSTEAPPVEEQAWWVLFEARELEEYEQRAKDRQYRDPLPRSELIAAYARRRARVESVLANKRATVKRLAADLEKAELAAQ